MRPEKIRGNVFVANLPLGLSDEQLAELFDPYGMVLRAHLARDPVSGEALGHGLVLLAPDRVVDDAVAALNGSVQAGRRMEARRADPDMSIAPPKPPRIPRGPGRSTWPVAAPGGAARDERAPYAPVPRPRAPRASGQPSYTVEWVRPRAPHASVR